MTENIKVLIRVKPLPEGSENCLQIEGQRISVVPGGIQANDTLKNTFQNTTLSRREVIMTPQRAGNIRPRLSFSARELDNEHDLSTARSDTAPIKLYAKERQTPRKKRTKSTGDAFSFQFDRVLTQNASQTEVFHEIQPFIIDAVKGFNTSIFAYGQTGSGKTYTMLGTQGEEHLGVIPRSVQTIFDVIQQNSDCRFNIRCSYVELHLDQFTDLLDPNSDPAVQKKMLPHQIIDMERKKKIEIRQNGKEIFLSGSKTLNTVVKTYEEAMKLIEQGQRCRSVAKTSLNAQSSRSHAIITFIIEKKDTNNNITRGKLHLIDLAGNERLSKSKACGDTMKETQNINASLEALANVLSGLASKQNLIRYRDSKLTRFLQDSLGGNSRTCFVVNIRSNAQYFRETIQSLKYGQRAKLIKNSVSLNVESPNTLIDAEELAKLQKEIATLRESLQSQSKTNETLSSENKQLLSENKQLRRRLHYFTVSQNKQVEQYQRKIDNLIHSQSTQLAENRYQYLNLQSNIACYRKQIYDLTCEISQIQQKNYLLSTSAQQARGEVLVLQENTEQLLQQRDTLEKKLIKCTECLQAQQEQLQSAQNQELEPCDLEELKKLEKANKNLTKKVEKMNQLLAASEESCDEIKNSLEDKLTTVTKELKELKGKPIEANKKLEKEISTLKNEAKEYNKKIAALERENRSYLRELGPTNPLRMAVEAAQAERAAALGLPAPAPLGDTSDNEGDTTQSSKEDESIMKEDDSFEALDCLEDIDDDFELVTKPKSVKRKGKQTPKVIGRKRTSMQFFNLDFSEESDSADSPAHTFNISQVKPVSKKRKVNSGAQTVALTLHNSTPKSAKKPKATKKAVLKNFFPTTSRFDNRLELVEDKENFALIQ
uniref:Kinesin-like protein n=1 Tax=Vannella robusta TaxID=1487602 RepID=A0A7S4IHT8_9EUKA|mmetsp:Transcript_2692/g.3304  ORF Transcript_2692/g.3304 Transcript_2692/m.3304 type:complete len:884 (+) Transcript_2692:109-2760(+)